MEEEALCRWGRDAPQAPAAPVWPGFDAQVMTPRVLQPAPSPRQDEVLPQDAGGSSPGRRGLALATPPPGCFPTSSCPAGCCCEWASGDPHVQTPSSQSSHMHAAEHGQRPVDGAPASQEVPLSHHFLAAKGALVLQGRRWGLPGPGGVLQGQESSERARHLEV